MTEQTYTITQSQLNTLSYALEQVGYQSMALDDTCLALINYRENEPCIVKAMLQVFGGAIGSQARELEQLANIIEGVHNQITGYDVEQARKALFEGLNHD